MQPALHFMRRRTLHPVQTRTESARAFELKTRWSWPDNSEPEPDAMLLAWREDGYAFRAPRPEDVLLLVEVSDSTLEYDRDVKMSLYAAAGVPEAWLVNLRDGLDRVQYAADSGRLPSSTRRYAPGDTIAPQAFPDLAIPVERIIPPRRGRRGRLSLHPYERGRHLTLTLALSQRERGSVEWRSRLTAYLPTLMSPSRERGLL